MIIKLPDGSRITLSTKSDSAGGALTVTAPGGVPKPVSFGQQLRALLAPLGDDAAQVHMETLLAWCAVALGPYIQRGHKAKRCNRANWQRSFDLIVTAQATEQMQAVA